MNKRVLTLLLLLAIILSGCSISKQDDIVKNYIPNIIGDNEGMTVDNVSFAYKVTKDFLYISGRFRLASTGTGDGFIYISYPDGITAHTMGAGSVGQVALSKAYTGPGLSVRTNSESFCFIQAGGGNASIQAIGNDTYVIISALIPRNVY